MSKQEEKDKMKVVTNKRPADEKVNEKPLKQMKLDFGENEATTAKQVERIFPAYQLKYCDLQFVRQSVSPRQFAFDIAVVNWVAQTGAGVHFSLDVLPS